MSSMCRHYTKLQKSIGSKWNAIILEEKKFYKKKTVHWRRLILQPQHIPLSEFCGILCDILTCAWFWYQQPPEHLWLFTEFCAILSRVLGFDSKNFCTHEFAISQILRSFWTQPLFIFVKHGCFAHNLSPESYVGYLGNENVKSSCRR